MKLLTMLLLVAAGTSACRTTSSLDADSRAVSLDPSESQDVDPEIAAELDRGGRYDVYPIVPTTHADPSQLDGRAGLGLAGPSPAVMSGLDAPDQLTLFVMSSPHGIAWTSPRDLLNSTVGNSLGHPPHPIGHVMVEVSCADRGDGAPGYVLAGMSDVDAAWNYALLVAQGAGLDFLFHSFPGRLQSDAEIRRDLGDYMNSASEGRRLAQLTHLITPATCKRLLQYFNDYQAYAVHTHFGLSLRPLYREGSGCSAFGVSTLAVAGVYQPAFDAWQTIVDVPYRFMKSGRREEGRLITRAPVRRIELFGGDWAQPGESSRQLQFWNPDKMQAWIVQAFAARTYTSLQHLGAGAVPVVVIDARTRPTPEGGYFYQ